MFALEASTLPASELMRSWWSLLGETIQHFMLELYLQIAQNKYKKYIK